MIFGLATYHVSNAEHNASSIIFLHSNCSNVILVRGHLFESDQTMKVPSSFRQKSLFIRYNVQLIIFSLVYRLFESRFIFTRTRVTRSDVCTHSAVTQMRDRIFNPLYIPYNPLPVTPSVLLALKPSYIRATLHKCEQYARSTRVRRSRARLVCA